MGIDEQEALNTHPHTTYIHTYHAHTHTSHTPELLGSVPLTEKRKDGLM